VVKRTL